MSLRIVGEERTRLFGLAPSERLRRQAAGLKQPIDARLTVVCRADIAVTDATLEWLRQHPGQILPGEDGAGVIALVDHEAAEGTALSIGDGAVSLPAEAGPTLFVRSLRRRQPLGVIDLRLTPRREAERRLFDLVYKGVTDVVTRHVWPAPAFWVTRLLAQARVTPNAVTAIGIVLTLLAAYLFYLGEWGTALAAAWTMTFLDTVDGKLARVTAKSSQFGSRLDHGNDWLHPPLWWVCVALGASRGAATEDATAIVVSGAVILVTYMIGRFSEFAFKRRIGFNQFLWRPFDGRLRGIIARRNIILLILTAGAIAGDVAFAFHVAAAWSVLTIGVQTVRWGQAELRRLRRIPVENWMA